MSQEQRDALLDCKRVLKWVIISMEATIGVKRSLPVTLKTLEAIKAVEALCRE